MGGEEGGREGGREGRHTQRSVCEEEPQSVCVCVSERKHRGRAYVAWRKSSDRESPCMLPD